MLPRKRYKPNPFKSVDAKEGADGHPEVVPQISGATTPIRADVEPSFEVPVPAPNAKINLVEPPENVQDRTGIPRSTGSWYGGTWPRGHKVTPVTQVAKESISAVGGAASDVVALAQAHTPQLPLSPLKVPTVYLSRTVASSSRSLPLAATTTKLNISSDATSLAVDTAKERRARKREDKALVGEDSNIESNLSSQYDKPEASPSEDALVAKSNLGPKGDASLPQDVNTTRDTSRWLNWFSTTARAEETEQALSKPYDKTGATSNSSTDRIRRGMLELHPEMPSISKKHRRNSEPSPTSPKNQHEAPPISWLRLWGNAATQKSDDPTAKASGTASNGHSSLSPSKSMGKSTRESQTISVTTPNPPVQLADTGKSSGWAFWSREQSIDQIGLARSGDNAGELALADSPSQSQPEIAVVDEAGGFPNTVERREIPRRLGMRDDKGRLRIVNEVATNGIAPKAIATNHKTAATTAAGSKPINVSNNLLLPPFRLTYTTAGRPSFIQQLSRLLQLSSPPDQNHVDIVPSPPRIRTALAIGVHGYFPAPLLQKVLGQPTGTSIRFSNRAAAAIERWTKNQGYACTIEKVALEGEGKISERIDLLWKLMLNWIDKIQKTDLVMVACHSQGVPVAMMLVAKLIAFGCVNSAKIGVCAMAGVNLGPFADYKSRWINGSAGELFDFARPDSQVSKDYEAALDSALSFGVRVVFTGSIDDQLVSLESSTFGTVSHPYIYRAVFVDGRVNAADFLTHLVGFALKLRNLGISDHGLIRELSIPLAGSLYSGEGHSRIYDDDKVYDLAVEHTLETTALGTTSLQVSRDNVSKNPNPYILPFAMRGLLEEDYVRTELRDEISELINQFDDWKPSSKILKDVKFRLEGVRSKL